MFYVGTSGFNYVEWIGRFYPDGLKRSELLRYYAAQFNSVEINYTFYRLPLAKTLTQWATQTPPEFRYSFKAPRQITHSAKLKDCAAAVERFYAALGDLLPLGALLFQLPPSVKRDLALLADFLAILPAGSRNAFEFRDASWFDDSIYAALHEHNAALCIADSPALSTPPIVTADFGYLRLRNEDYALADIERWARIATELAVHWGDTYVYFKHEDLATGPRFATHFQAQLTAPASAAGAYSP